MPAYDVILAAVACAACGAEPKGESSHVLLNDL